MNVRFEKCNSDNKIENVKIVLNNGVQRVKWNFKRSDGFFILCYRHDHDIDIFSYIAEYMSKCESEKGIRDVNDDLILISVPKSSYSSNGTELGKKNFFLYPMKVIILGFSVENGELIITEQCDDDNTDYIQYTIKYSQRFNNGFLMIKQSKETIRVPYFDGFFEGLIYYTIEGSNAKYPISSSMLNNEFDVFIQREGMFSLKINDDYKKLYRCSCN